MLSKKKQDLLRFEFIIAKIRVTVMRFTHPYGKYANILTTKRTRFKTRTAIFSYLPSSPPKPGEFFHSSAWAVPRWSPLLGEIGLLPCPLHRLNWVAKNRGFPSWSMWWRVGCWWTERNPSGQLSMAGRRSGRNLLRTRGFLYRQHRVLSVIVCSIYKKNRERESEMGSIM